ncbi:MotA/TolQ/ExbB proton channel family protein [Candidatus Methylacidithermus pantelleriae]|uniref:MotA/TolQ/ExbB proton channel family protein n=1 Tax=Candidatus Methylacidithermus pantelleriae TaxID=2744239 RepID=A0A8J2BH61_9BACT|nr:MotA/TolQ/ExbB proton channel family protein [Candidatus Methylacidithermus pantelleriae]CAF0693934.1 MotA/TolQ/ExbB proton channel family protein [Candidatus Methylacidithermus pantelleriae]
MTFFAAATVPTLPQLGKVFTVWELLQSAGWVMIPLLGVSVAVVGLVFYYLVSLRDSRITTPELEKKVDAFIEKEDWTGLAGYLRGRSQALARLLRSVLHFVWKQGEADPEAIRAVAESTGSAIVAELGQRVMYLLDLGVIAPMVGLFGTVIGILRSFGSIAAEPSPMRTMLLAGGVSQALVSTAVGLIVGITAMLFYSYFRGKVQRLVSLFEERATLRVQELVLAVKREKGKLSSL